MKSAGASAAVSESPVSGGTEKSPQKSMFYLENEVCGGGLFGDRSGHDEIAALSWQLGARNWEFPEIVNVPGTSVATEFQDEYQIDEAGLTDLVIDTFYRKTGQ